MKLDNAKIDGARHFQICRDIFPCLKPLLQLLHFFNSRGLWLQPLLLQFQTIIIFFYFKDLRNYLFPLLNGESLWTKFKSF